MNDNFKEALDNVYNEESAQYLIGKLTEFSPRFEREMDKMIGGKKSARSVGKHAFKIVLIAAACAAVLGISLTAGAAATQGFTTKSGIEKFWNKPTVTFKAAGAENAPKTLEKYYTLKGLPEGLDYTRQPSINDDNTRYVVRYTPSREDYMDNVFMSPNEIKFAQYTKDEFETTFETPKYVEVKQIKIGGTPGYLITSERVFGTQCYVIRDEGDYILYLSCIMPADEAVALAENVVLCGDPMNEEVLR